MILADEFIRAGHDAPRDPAFGPYRHVAHEVARAHRFTIGEEPQDAVGNLLSHRPSALLEAISWARLPFPITWMEWTPAPMTERVEGHYSASRVGALLRQESDKVIRLFVCWALARATMPEANLDGVPQRYLPFFRRVHGLGISALEGAWDFGRLTGQPMLDVKEKQVWLNGPGTGWFQPSFATDHPEAFAEAAVRKHHTGYRYALKDPAELIAIKRIERCVAFRIHREALGGTSLMLANATLGTVTPLIRDVEDEMGRVLALLILMNARNCVDIAKVEPPPRLNRARRLRRLPPLVDYSTVHIRLNRPDQRAAQSGDYEPTAISRHIVRGHFKVRATGVYWWRPHMRGIEEAGVVIRKGYDLH